MDAALVRQVWQRANGHCEYCRISQHFDPIRFEIDHIIALKHGGPTARHNLALCCYHDNSHKGSNISGLDPKTRTLTPLFNPRRQKWRRGKGGRGPFSLEGGVPRGNLRPCLANHAMLLAVSSTTP